MTKIMTCVDGSAITDAVTDAAIWASKKLNKPICFLHTLEKEQQHGADDFSGAIGLGARSALLEEMTLLDEKRGKIALQLGKELLNTVSQKAHSAGVKDVEMMQRHGDIVDATEDLYDKTRLIVVGRCGEGHDGNFSALGSHVETLLRKACHPVLIVPAKFNLPSSFMVAYDGRDTADIALQKVIEGGLLHGLHCHLVSVKNNETELKDKLDLAKQRMQDEGFTVSSAFIEGDIHQSLMQYKTANKIDLMVMGAFAHSKLRRFFVGSNTLKMLEHCDVPLIVLR
ncbi:universal stress protein [Paraglaciecola arctica]|uniref:universal stress protein n=1 Tax=Paraglaciecola arctica TaxID=1128911 RepID=UPI001C0681A0|nr:universal stress protein [Paraglaciecola arctica]MBU3002399.1 universal stress protein [Paraglaciecola arctica]